MAKPKLRTTVHVDGKAYGPGEVPSEIAARISNPNVWDGDVPVDAGSDVPEQALSPILTGASSAPTASEELAKVAAERDAALAELAALKSGQTSADGAPPPKGGPGSGREAWAAYATGKVEVSAEMSRDDIVAALTAAGVPTELPA